MRESSKAEMVMAAGSVMREPSSGPYPNVATVYLNLRRISAPPSSHRNKVPIAPGELFQANGQRLATGVEFFGIDGGLHDCQLGLELLGIDVVERM